MSLTIQTYIAKVNEQYQTGKATEHSYRGALQDLVSAIISNDSISVVNEPKRSECGAPDYIISKGEIPLGFIEAKDIGKNLDDKLYKEQFGRYKKGLENLIITDYLEFRFYRNGELYDRCTIAEAVDGTINSVEQSFEHFTNLIKDFVTFVGQTIKSPSKLAELMAGKARVLAEVIRGAIESDEESAANSTLRDQMNAFQQILIHDITPAAFADIYAQTITYGMFAARLHDTTPDDFSRQEAASLIPKTNPFLRNLFQYISGYDVDDRILWIVDSLAEIFVHTDIAKLLKNFGKATRTHDPIIHFYETFLAEYDPKLRKARGVWYTPEPVVNFIVRAVDDILKTEFNLPEGLADTSKTKIKVQTQTKDARTSSGFKEVEEEVHKVQILDPATGTGTFLAEVVKHIAQKFVGMEGIWSNYVEKDLIPRLNGFEILMASYAMAHLKLDLLLKETGYVPNNPDRFRVFLTNSLEEAHPDTGTLFANWLSQEASEANAIKRDAPVMCVIGNPPYSNNSTNKGEWILDLIKEYKKNLNEKKVNLDDDYIKFIRYGEHFIEKNGEGILAYISNNSFIDGITHRQMRKKLLETFDKIYILDLHGNSKKKETCPDGSRDENVFDIQQGVSINIFVKTGKSQKKEYAQVLHFDQYGKRKNKYLELAENSINSIKWNQLPLDTDNLFFTSKDFTLSNTYDKYLKIAELFKYSNSGMQTKKDELSIHFNQEELCEAMDELLSADTDFIKRKLGIKKDGRDWTVDGARQDITNRDLGCFINVQYKPFDTRKSFFTGNSKGFVAYPRKELTEYLIHKDNIALSLMRQIAVNAPLSQFMITTDVMTDRAMYSTNGTPYLFPLYLYPSTTQIEGTPERTPNLDPKILKQIEKKLKLTFTPEKEETAGTFAPIDLLDYIYAVLHSPSYREKYKEFLKIDFPRVPFPEAPEKFWDLVELGGEIRALHLMESNVLNTPIATYPKAGDNIVTRKLTTKDSWESIDDETGRVWINDDQYFDKVPLKAWEFYIGGYQPAQKWLKDRKERELSVDDIRHYMKIIVALVETDRVMKEIDVVGVE